MRIYSLHDCNTKTLAISDEIYLVELFKAQRHLQNKTEIKIYKGKEAEDIQIVNEDVYLYQYDDIIVTALEMRLINKIINEGECKLSDIALELLFILKNYKFEPEEQDILINAAKILKKVSKKKRIFKLLDVKSFIQEIAFKADNFVNSFYNQFHK